eukprot:TRINITY_DN12361_c0_g1_i4.p1 TRINITY_DN12361_c0_g1~~TRINITY_DN12361_c0_g1_i4.p1  ORF type:complete len:455 (-),score=55.87 TRINITY_DN12361_c0_g1_i4:79-1443(-)
MTNMTNMTGNTSEECCLPKCEAFTCSGNWTSNQSKNDVLGNTSEDCCEIAMCKDYSCGSGYVNNLLLAGNSFDVCCSPTCESFACSGAWKNVIGDPAKLVGDSPEACCALKLCEEYGSCPSGYVKTPNASSVAGHTSEQCCLQLCELFECTDEWENESNSTIAWVNAPNRSSTIGNSTEVCCERPKCIDFSCPSGYSNNTGLGNTQAECCNPTCELSCPSGYANIGGNGTTQAECCDATCELLNCSGAWKKAPSKNATISNDTEVCCEKKMCIDFATCPWGYVRDETAEGYTEEVCCHATCEVFNCSGYYTNNSAKLYEIGNTSEECCDLQESCCEKSSANSGTLKCDTFVGKTPLDEGVGCNTLMKDQCESRYFFRKELGELEMKTYTACAWASVGSFELCRNTGPTISKCFKDYFEVYLEKLEQEANQTNASMNGSTNASMNASTNASENTP